MASYVVNVVVFMYDMPDEDTTESIVHKALDRGGFDFEIQDVGEWFE